MRRLLFVDDEQQLLDAMRNLLRRQRKQWDMVFALSGAAALEEMKKAPFDVIVSDMRMPEMDGCALLEQVRSLYPNTGRIVLSGHAEPETIKRALAVAHQFLSKPCDSETLRSAIERTARLHSTLMAEPIQRIVSAMETSPGLPAIYAELQRATASPEFDVEVVSEILARDSATHDRMLGIINLPLVGLPQRVSSVSQAAVLLGVDWARILCFSAAITIANDAAPTEDLPRESLRTNALVAARVARTFFRDPQNGQQAFSAALAYTVGQFVAARGARDAFLELERALQTDPRPRHEVEREKLGATCDEIGAAALSRFGVCFSILEAIAFRGEPGRVIEGDRELLAAVHAACCFVNGTEPDTAFFDAAKLTDELPRWRALALQQLAQPRAA